MKRLLPVLLSFCFLVCAVTPAFATEESQESILPEQPAGESEREIVTVSTLDELQAAIEAAEDGDTIALGKTIYINGQALSTDKDITVVRATSFTTGRMISISSGVIYGLNFNESTESASITASPTQGKIVIQNCNFDGGCVGSGVTVLGILPDENNTQIVGCEFTKCFGNAIIARGSNINLTVKDCYIHDCSAIIASGAVQSMGNLLLDGCTITNNTSWANAGVMCTGGTLTMSNCQIKDNIILSPDKGIAVDIFCQNATWSITDNEHEGAGYYDIVTGNKVSLPVAESTETAKLIYLTTQQAAEYFAPSPAPDDEEQDGDTPTETPTEPPKQPESGEGEDTPADDDNPPTTPAPPQDEPEDDGEDDYTPPVINRPTHPIRPVVPTPAPETEQKEPATALVCGDAVIDTSRSVILLGYGDGQLHLEDNLTRAQMATIIYRLLDADSIARYDSTDTIFDDVAPEAWYCRYVTTIANAGIVCGVGNDSYDPDAPLTWGHIIAVMSRFVEAQERPLQYIICDGWARQAVETAVVLGWIEDSTDINPDTAITRGEFVKFINFVLEKYR